MITNGTLFRIFWLLLFVRASSLVTDEALLIASCIQPFWSPSREDGVSFHGYVVEKGCQLNKRGGDVGQDNRVSLLWYVWGDNWWNIITDVCRWAYCINL